MQSRSLKRSFIIFIAAMVVQTAIVLSNAYLHRLIESAEMTRYAVIDVEQTFLECLSMEPREGDQTDHGASPDDGYAHIRSAIQKDSLPLDAFLIDRRQELNGRLVTLLKERSQGHRRLREMLPSLTASVRYIHEHHMAYLSNLLARDQYRQDYDVGEGFKRSPVGSATELEIIAAAVSIQTSLLDIFETFSRIERGFSPAAVSTEFKSRMEQFYSTINRFEDYSLDAQDGLLVEELLLIGRTFEDSFHRFLSIEKTIRTLVEDRDANRRFFSGSMQSAKQEIENSYKSMESKAEYLYLCSLAVSIVMLGVLVVSGSRIVKALRKTVAETRRIQADRDYRVPLNRGEFAEFQVIYSALNAMAQKNSQQFRALDEARNRLEDRVSERTRELNRLNAQLTEEINERNRSIVERCELESELIRARKMEALGTLAGGVAHDLNNILSGIVGYPELILMDLPGDSPLRSSIETIKSSGEKAAAVVQDLLTLARRGVTQRTVCNINQIIRDLLQSPEGRQIQDLQPGTIFQVDFDPDLPNISGSTVHLSKSVLNLINNAVEAMPEGGQVSIATTHRCIDRPFGRYEKFCAGEYAVLTVSDTGIGIAETDLPRIFEPFYTKKKMGRSGTGLGMAVVWGTVKDHGGHIDVQSGIGRGTTFEIYLPVTRKSLIRDMETPSLESFRGEGHILVVDDEEVQRQLAREILTKLGYTVHLVTSGEEALT